jgi:hypothetical protein
MGDHFDYDINHPANQTSNVETETAGITFYDEDSVPFEVNIPYEVEEINEEFHFTFYVPQYVQERAMECYEDIHTWCCQYYSANLIEEITIQ